jgi:adhesin transport system membrane fusion protein
MMRPMVAQGVRSKVEFLKLQREQSQILSELQSARDSIPIIKAAIDEIDHTIEETKSAFRSKAKTELNEAMAQMLRTKEEMKAYSDQVQRTLVRSPIDGVIQTLFVNTIGGVVRPGEKLAEIVPTEDALWIEAKIKPSDIAFIYPGQKAIVKFTAYDYAIYGGLEGEVVHISADTTQDKDGNEFYLVHIRTDQNHLGTPQKPLKIIPGMHVRVDIITGKKSLMDYILKPILRAKQYTFSER